jgi:hypothetical protein
MRSVEHVERVKDTKMFATIITGKPLDNTTLEGTKHIRKTITPATYLTKNGFKIFLLRIRDDFGKNPETAEVSRGSP